MVTKDFYVEANLEKLDEVAYLNSAVLQEPDSLNPDWLSKHGWICVPVEEDGPYEDKAINELVSAGRTLGVEWVYATLAEPLINSVPLFNVRLTHDGLRAFRKQCSMFCYLLITPTPLFGILCTKEDYTIYAGTKEVVEVLLAKTVDEARADFRSYAADWSGEHGTYLLKIAEGLANI